MRVKMMVLAHNTEGKPEFFGCTVPVDREVFDSRQQREAGSAVAHTPPRRDSLGGPRHVAARWSTVTAVTRQECGWPAHYCCATRCVFHRTTTLSCGESYAVVSTVGRFVPNHVDGAAERDRCGSLLRDGRVPRLQERSIHRGRNDREDLIRRTSVGFIRPGSSPDR